MSGLQTLVKSLQKNETCQCGRKHDLPIREIEVGSGLLEMVPNRIKGLGLNGTIHLVADCNTMAAAGQRLREVLYGFHFNVTETVFETGNEELVPDEQSLARLVLDIPAQATVLVAVGSGTINDLVRFIAYKMGKPFISIPTAPSMDGYASSVAPLLEGGFKRTFPARPPLAIYADLDVLCNAPLPMIAAGFGDLVGKFTARADWVISRILHDEYFCQASLDVMTTALEQCTANPSRLRHRDKQVIRQLTEGLILSGIAIMMAGSSRPASGAEHLLAHYWEVRSFRENAHHIYHGAKVGVATPLILQLYERIRRTSACQIDIAALEAQFIPPAEQEIIIRQHYGPLAEEVLRESAKKRVSWPERRQKLALIQQKWSELVEAVAWLPSPAAVIEMLEDAGAPTTPAALGLPESWVFDAFRFARAMRQRYTVLDLADEVGLLLPYSGAGC